MDMPEKSRSSDLTAAFESLRSELSRCIIGQAALVDRLLRVDDEVQRHLLDLGEVGVHLPFGLHVDAERDPAGVEIAAAKLHHLVDDLAEVDEGRRPRLLA